jgi:hypothetical protein
MITGNVVTVSAFGFKVTTAFHIPSAHRFSSVIFVKLGWF